MTKRGPDLFNQPIGDELDWLQELIRRAGEDAAELRDRDIQFVDSMTLRIDKFGERTFVSEAQRKWLKDIERRLDEAEDGDPVARPVDEVMSGNDQRGERT